jgi:hypothetical protein
MTGAVDNHLNSIEKTPIADALLGGINTTLGAVMQKQTQHPGLIRF